MSSRSGTRALHQLAHLWGVQTAFYDVGHRRRQATPDALLAVLRAMGAPVETVEDALPALREQQQATWNRRVEPVVVAWRGAPVELELRLPASQSCESLQCELELESGEVRSWSTDLGPLVASQTADVEGVRYACKRLPIPSNLPLGYHRLKLRTGRHELETLVVATPGRAYAAADRPEARAWGIFAPLYSLHSERSWGAGDFSDLETLLAGLAKLGGSVVATLPLLPLFLDTLFQASPYAPVSRLAWNEFYVDMARVPELEQCPQAQRLLRSRAVLDEIHALRQLQHVDYRRQMALKRRVLEKLCDCCFNGTSGRRDALQRFVQANETVADYARFRATCERQGTPWADWQPRLRDGALQSGDYDEKARDYHLYVQWLAHQQIESVATDWRRKGSMLCLDFPLGVHPGGYDVWRNQDLFAQGMSIGAPPDMVFTKGQDWAIPPFHPERLRRRGYDYHIACLRHHLRFASILRIDHVMGLHRLFWIPAGMDARQGVYVRYPAEELYAIMTLESHRHRAILVGEDLGTVPPEVRPMMNCHGLYRYYVAQYEFCTDCSGGVRGVPARSLASVNTHDMPPFAAFWQGLDIRQRQRLGLLDAVGARRERQDRQAIRKSVLGSSRQQQAAHDPSLDCETALGAVLSSLSSSAADIVVVNLEDLWGETEPQNMPGTKGEYPNWQRKMRHPLEALCRLPRVAQRLREVDRIRKGKRR